MRYEGAEALSIEATAVEQVRPAEYAPSGLEVVTGGGLDERARRGVDAGFLTRARLVVIVAAVFALLGFARVTVTAATTSLLSENVKLSQSIEEARTTNDALSVERSLMSSNARISRIATQNYGMTQDAEHVALTLPAASSAEGDQSTSASSAPSFDGDVAQAATNEVATAPLS